MKKKKDLNIHYNLEALKATFASAAARRLFARGADDDEKNLVQDQVCGSLDGLLPSLQDQCEQAARHLASLGCRVKFYYHADAFAIFASAGVEVADRVFDEFILRWRA